MIKAILTFVVLFVIIYAAFEGWQHLTAPEKRNAGKLALKSLAVTAVVGTLLTAFVFIF